MKTNILEKNQNEYSFNTVYENTFLTFEKNYDIWIRPMELSPLMFNSFHWVVNLRDQKIVYSSGVKKILGADEFNLTLEKTQNLTHPNFRTVIKALSAKVFDLFKSMDFRSFSKEAHFCTQFPIQHMNGTFVLVQQSCTVLSVDSEYNCVEVYYRFENLGKYLGFPIFMKPRLSFNAGGYSKEIEKIAEAQIAKEVNNVLMTHLNLTRKQTQVIGLLSRDKSIGDITQELNITVETIKVHNKNILSKAKDKISPMFTNAREVSIFLKEVLTS
jgi:DNA-binding CsgD family transcriptional regulator